MMASPDSRSSAGRHRHSTSRSPEQQQQQQHDASSGGCQHEHDTGVSLQPSPIQADDQPNQAQMQPDEHSPVAGTVTGADSVTDDEFRDYDSTLGEMTVCPIGSVHRVLDVGTGTGIWAIDFAEEHPESVVVGVDVSPIQPHFVPPNCVFEIDDLEKPWTFSYKFDFIHSRMMTGSFQDWPKFAEQCYNNLEPGGWIEMIDVSFPNRSDDETLAKDSALQQWGNYMLEASVNLGCPLNTAETYRGLLRDSGFIGIEEKLYKWPQNRWPTDKKLKEIGLWTLENFTSNLSGLSAALFTRGLGWSMEDLEVFLVNVRKEMRDQRIHSYWPIYVVYAQKPRGAQD